MKESTVISITNSKGGVGKTKLLVPPFIEGFLSYLREYLKELEVM